MDIKFFISVGATSDWSEELFKAVCANALTQEVMVLVKILIDFGTLAQISGVPVVSTASRYGKVAHHGVAL